MSQIKITDMDILLNKIAIITVEIQKVEEDF